MKLLIGDGNSLEVRDVGPVLGRLKARPGGPPIKFNGRELMEEHEAREKLKELIGMGLYDWERLA